MKLDERIQRAIDHFWDTRTSQAERQGAGPERDRGARAAVTGGRQMDGFVALVRDLLLESGVPESAVFTNSRLELPGWYRAEKKWDLVIVHKSQFLAAAEFKSQIGPSFGNNFNNRTEEALGSATDLWAAYREGAFKPSPRPWLGYLMLLEDCPQSRATVAVKSPHFHVFPDFNRASYARRYELLMKHLVRDRLYDQVCFLTTSANDGAFSEPNVELKFESFATSLLSHVRGRIAPL